MTTAPQHSPQPQPPETETHIPGTTEPDDEQVGFLPVPGYPSHSGHLEPADMPGPKTLRRRIGDWLMADLGDVEKEEEGHFELTEYEKKHQHPWWRVMCLTGVDYFSTLGYQPGIAFLAAGALSPIATAILILVTLFGALPIYQRVADESPHGEGSIAMLRGLLSWWKGKIFVLVLLGFAATDFIITITLSAADATAHMIQNPFMPSFLHGQQIILTLILVAILGVVFLKGFGEAIGVATVLVVVYLALNAVVVVVGLMHVAANPEVLGNWQVALTKNHGSPVGWIAASLLLFPKLALGLSGFETGVAVMPLLRGDPGDQEDYPKGRVRNARKLLTAAALIMSVFLITSSIVTTTLIPAEAWKESTTPGVETANGRALAYLAHEYLGEAFGTVYDISTIAILWFAGASAMAGLLNLVPNYLPKYGMAPAWAVATRPLVLVFTAIGFAVTLIFNADVNAQGGAYATGVLVLMSSAAVAVTLSAWWRKQRTLAAVFVVITLVFFFTTVVNVMERPDGVKIASVFITTILLVSLVSRIVRATELRVTDIEVDETAQRFIKEAAINGLVRFVANEPQSRDRLEYLLKEWEEREHSHIPRTDPVLFLEVTVTDASEFAPLLRVRGEEIDGYRVLAAESSSVSNAIAGFALWVRDNMKLMPHLYFGWTEGHPVFQALRFLLFGEGDVPPVTREVLRNAEPDPAVRPVVHVS